MAPKKPIGVFDGVTIKPGDDARAAASAMTGHIRDKGDDRTFRWMRGDGSAPGTFSSPPRPGVSGQLAPHHVFGLKRWAGLLQGFSAEDTLDFNNNFMPVGRRLGDYAQYNLEGVEQDTEGTGSRLTGWHAVQHEREEALFKQFGFTKSKDGKIKWNNKDWESLPIQLRKGVLSSFAFATENTFDEVEREASADFRSYGPNKFNKWFQQMRERDALAKPQPSSDARPTSASTKVMMAPSYAETLGPTALENIQAAELENQQRLTTQRVGLVRAHAAATGQPDPFRNPTLTEQAASRGVTAPTSGTTRRKKKGKLVKDTTGGTDLGAFDGLGHDPTEFIPKGRVQYADDGGVDAGLPPMLPISGV